jgi:hypothetical protein
MRIRDVPRETDDRVLDWLQLHERGVPWPEIARRYGINSYQTVQRAVRAVLREMDDDE